MYLKNGLKGSNLDCVCPSGMRNTGLGKTLDESSTELDRMDIEDSKTCRPQMFFIAGSRV